MRRNFSGIPHESIFYGRKFTAFCNVRPFYVAMNCSLRGYRSVAWVLWSGEELRPLTGASPQRDGCGGECIRGDDDHADGGKHNGRRVPFVTKIITYFI